MFQFTPVVRRATARQTTATMPQCFNSRPSCDGRLVGIYGATREIVSIHARRATGDVGRARNEAGRIVSIHARRATGDRQATSASRHQPCFNSRPSCDGRRAARRRESGSVSFNSRPSCDGRHFTMLVSAEYCVSIHARRATGDTGPRHRLSPRFQFTPVVRRATEPCGN